MKIDVAANPIAHMKSRAELPRYCRTVPASTDDMGIRPWEMMLVMLVTLLSLSPFHNPHHGGPYRDVYAWNEEAY